MCHHRTSDWYAERSHDGEEADSESDDRPDYAAEIEGREVDDPEVAAPEFEESEVDTPELDDEADRPATAPSDDPRI